MRVYLANIGANSNHRGLFSPLMEGSSFAEPGRIGVMEHLMPFTTD